MLLVFLLGKEVLPTLSSTFDSFEENRATSKLCAQHELYENVV